MGARRKTRTRRKSKKKLPNWALLALGLAIGVLLAWGIQYTVRQAQNTNSGLSKLVRKTLKKQTIKKKSIVKIASKKTTKTKFQFYEILTKNESLLPAHVRDDNQTKEHAAKKNIRYALQVAALTKHDDADRLRAKLVLSGFEAHIHKVSIPNKGVFHRVRLGPFVSITELDDTNRKLKKMGFQAQRIKIKP